jgi:hypothetical protein
LAYLMLKRASTSRPSGDWNEFDVLADGAVVGRIMKSAAAPVGQPWLWTLAYGHHEDRTSARPRWRSHQTPCSPLPAITSALGYNEDRRQLQLMVGRQARHGGPTCGAEYILSEARGRGRRRCGVGREEDSDQRCQDRCPAIFISKIFSQKIWPKNWGGSSNGGFRERHVCGSGSAPPRPPFVQMKNTGGSFFPPAFRQRSGGARQQFRLLGAESRISVCRSFGPYLQPHPPSRPDSFVATFLPQLTLREIWAAVPRSDGHSTIHRC